MRKIHLSHPKPDHNLEAPKSSQAICTFSEKNPIKPKIERATTGRAIPINSESWEGNLQFDNKFSKLNLLNSELDQQRPKTRIGRTRGAFRVSKRKKCKRPLPEGELEVKPKTSINMDFRKPNTSIVKCRTQKQSKILPKKSEILKKVQVSKKSDKFVKAQKSEKFVNINKDLAKNFDKSLNTSKEEVKRINQNLSKLNQKSKILSRKQISTVVKKPGISSLMDMKNKKKKFDLTDTEKKIYGNR